MVGVCACPPAPTRRCTSTSGKAEKCTLCYPRLEAGQPTICSETCVGRLRYLGVIFYDADRVSQAAAVEDPQDLYMAQRSIMLDPRDPQVVAGAHASGIPDTWIEAAKSSPIWDLINTYEVALPIHPEYRTMPMVWYVPPLSPVVDEVANAGFDAEDHRVLLSAVADMRIPMEYLAGLFTAGDVNLIERTLRRLAAMRSHMRARNLGQEPDPQIAASVGMDGQALERMYRLLAIAKYDDRFVVPTTRPEVPRGMEAMGDDVAALLGEGAPSACASGCTDVSGFHGADVRRSGRVSLPLPSVRSRRTAGSTGPGAPATTGARQ